MPVPLFSVIIPTYARPFFLASAIDSVLAQTVEDYECIVVDDASPVPVEVPRDPRIRLVRRAENGGPAAARNTGLKLAKCRYVVFLDDDDLYTTDRLAMSLEGLGRAPLSICGTRYLHSPSGVCRVIEGHARDTILEARIPHLGTVTVERTLVPAFDERFIAAEDIEWWLRIAQHATVTTVRRIGYLLRNHPTPRHRINLTTHIEGRLLLLRLHATYFAAHPRAAAFQWKRIGHLARKLGDNRLAHTAFHRSLSLHPEIKTFWHLARSLWFSKPSRDAKDNSVIWDR
jgi:glycosyltransferase involved in cell wall biosynthesis